MITATVFEAKTKLSALIRKAQAGEEVIITSGRDKKPVARLEAVKPIRRLGVLHDPTFEIPESFWEPLAPGWDGTTEPSE